MESTSRLSAVGASPVGISQARPVSLHGRKAAAIPWGLGIAALICFACVDIPLAGSLAKAKLPSAVHKLLGAAEHYGTFYGEILILLTMVALLADRRRLVVRVAASAWCAGLTANLIKLLIARTRPKHFDFSHVLPGHGFLSLFPAGQGGSRVQSFPSAHTATAAGLTIALAHFFPRGRPVFWGITILVGLQRFESHSHFASDVLAGALVGWLVGVAFTRRTALSRAFDRFEAAI